MQSALAATTPTPVRAVDRIVAVVNKNVITQYDLQRRMDDATKQLVAQKVTPPSRIVAMSFCEPRS